jgi:hypothetical protein
MTKTFYKVQENFLRRYFVANFLAAAGAAEHFPALCNW